MKNNKKIIILGAGGTSKDILDLLFDLEYSCEGLLDDDKNKWSKSINGVKVLGPLSQALNYENTYFINGIGNPSNFTLKEKIITALNIPSERFLTLIHPSASISKASIVGRGSVIFQNVVVSSNVKIGKHTVILPNSIISHDNEIGDYTCIASGVCISGFVKVGKLCYLGSGSLIKEKILIESQSLVGMGSLVLSDVPKNSVYVGNPAKFLKKVS